MDNFLFSYLFFCIISWDTEIALGAASPLMNVSGGASLRYGHPLE